MLSTLGNTQLVRDVKIFYHRLFNAKRAAGIRRKHERSQREMAEAEVELMLDDAASTLQLPQNHPLVIASVIFHAQRNAERREMEEDAAQNYPHYLDDNDW